MTTTEQRSWPPRSPHAALLSSPSGRRKYQQYLDGEQPLSPSKRAKTRVGEEGDQNAGASDDEETLQLKLAAIEARLALKKLQSRGKENADKKAARDQPPSSNLRPAERPVQVPVSPTRKPIQAKEQRSPGRVLLGIDKGLKGSDVSLRRAQSTRSGRTLDDGPGSRFAERMAIPRSQSTRENLTRSRSPRKTFSERMAESRAGERSSEARRDIIANKRTTGFKLNHEELDGYRKAAESAHHHPPSPFKDRPAPSFSRNEIVPAHKTPSGLLKRSSTVPNIRGRDKEASESGTVGGKTSDDGKGRKGDSSLYDPFSQLHLSSRTIPHEFLEKTFPSESHSCMRLPQLLKQVKAPEYELPGLESQDVVVVGILASKSNPLDHKHKEGSLDSKSDAAKKWDDGSHNQKRFMVFQLSDLKWTVDLFLFGTAVPKYHRLAPGTVVALLNPGVMRPKKGKEDTNAFSLTLHHGEDTLLEIGTARDLGFCDAVRKDGKKCGSWVNLQKTEICEWHLNAQITKTQAGRMGVNTGSNTLGRSTSGSTQKRAGRPGSKPETTGLLPTDGRKYHSGIESQYYIVSSGTSHLQKTADRGQYFQKNAAALLDEIDDDPFIAEGRLARDTQSRLKKRLQIEEKERDIAQKLSAMGAGGAGGEYLRKRLAPTSSDGVEGVDGDGGAENGRRKARFTREDVLGSERNGNGKRPAESVRLSPLKRTRFITEKGIREAGRDSLGGFLGGDDELEFV